MYAMVTLVFMLIGIALIVLQTTAFHNLPHGLGRPDMVYLLVVFSAYRFPWFPGLVLVFIIGWVFDVLSGVNLGVYPLLCLCVFVSLKLIALRNPVKSFFYEIPLVGVSFFLTQIVVFFLFSMALEDNLLDWAWGEVFRESVLLVLAAIPCFFLFDALYSLLEKRVQEKKTSRKQPIRPRR